MKGTILNKLIKGMGLRRPACHVLAGTALLLAGLSQAQTIYRIVGPDGKVTFSDKPPISGSAKSASTGGGSGNASGGGSALPFELRQVVSKFPVTLYTSNNCGPCGSGRSLLSSRGIPFSEKTVNTAEDAEALQRMSGDNSLPLLHIGGQQIKGYSDSEWTQFLNAAGYPQSSQLPTGYRNPAPAPLVVVQKPTPPVKQEEKTPAPAAADSSRPPVNSSANPAGITF